MRRLPPLNALRAFEAAARHLSFNHAAEELSVTPSAISHQVRVLEEFLGARLFRRLSRRVVLTPQGQSYLPPISAALQQIDTATRKVASSKPATALTLSVAPSFAAEWLIPRLPGFQAEYPDIEVRLVTAHRIPDFARADVDLAITTGHGEWPGLCCHKLIDEEVVPVCRSSLLKGRNALQSPQDLQHATLIHVLPRMDRWPNWLTAAGVLREDPLQGPKFATTTLALEAAEMGLGVVLANRTFAEPHLKAGHLVVAFDFDLPTERGYYLVYTQAQANNQTAVAFRDWLLEITAGKEGVNN